MREVKAIGQRVLLDEGFTEAAWKETLKRDRWDICHIASHFDFRGSEIESGLLLGDGRKLTLERLKLLPQDAFASISLITLSACQTATQDTDRSRGIVENFSVLAQRKGAGAVLASLWSVDDEATASLMVEFYRRWRCGEGKAQALQGAQLALLKGEAPPLGAKRGIESGTLPPPDAAPYPASETLRHPYYWAPFNLYGNTK